MNTSFLYIAKYRIDLATNRYIVELPMGAIRILSTYNMHGWLKANGYKLLHNSNTVAKIKWVS